jgi:hypothetical protein
VAISSIVTFILLGIPINALATPISIESIAGPDIASIQGTVDTFRTDVSSGGVNNGNTVGSLPNGRREINWDGGGAAAPATIFPSPMNTFNAAPTTRGLVSLAVGAGTGFEISGMPNPEFGDINPTYPAIFQPFSAPRIFTPLGNNVMDVVFFSPGTNIPASVFGFGAVFTDVDLANTSSLQFFNTSDMSLGTFFVPPFDNGLSFLGVTFTDAIGRVRITTGNTPLSATANDGGGTDVVALDDFIYSEPQALAAAAVPEPSTIFLVGAGAAAIARTRRRSRS